jgi:hypothetical protein
MSAIEKDYVFKTFIKHRSFLKKAGVTLEHVTNLGSPFLFVDNPVIISGFAGFVKKAFAKKNIYFRGESRNNAHVIPSLFRDKGTPLAVNNDIQNRFRAYNDLKKRAVKHYKDRVSRFYEDVDVLFQHYGIKSPVIDLVDNIYVAMWFGMDGNTDGYGYIRIMNTTAKEISVGDLRKEHSSLSLRLHTQHGLIMKKNVSRWNKSNIYFDEYEVARIKFPADTKSLNGMLFSKANIYPDTTLDNTFKILKGGWLDDEIKKVEAAWDLQPGVLGMVQ